MQNRLTAERVVPVSASDASWLFWYSRLSQLMGRWRTGVMSSFWVWLGRNEGSLLFSFVFGGTQILEENAQKIIKQVGLSHMVAASGLQVGLLSQLVGLLPLPGPIWRKKILQLAIIWFYAWTALLAASILRAAVMASLAILAPVWQKKSSPLWYLLLAVAILIWWAPILIFSPGFQLSVLASLGLILQSPSWLSSLTVGVQLGSATQPRSGSWTEKLIEYVKSAGQMSLTAQIWTMPVVLYHFGQVSIWSVVSTTLVSWLAAPLFDWGLLLTVLSSLRQWDHLLKPMMFSLAVLPQVMTQVFMTIARFLDQTSQLSLSVSHFPIWLAGVWYSALISWLWFQRRSTPRLTVADL